MAAENHWLNVDPVAAAAEVQVENMVLFGKRKATFDEPVVRRGFGKGEVDEAGFGQKRKRRILDLNIIEPQPRRRYPKVKIGETERP